MKFHIIILLCLSLVGLFSNSYAATGDFILSFDGSDGVGELVNSVGIAVDSNDRIIIIDNDAGVDLVKIFDKDGIFITSFDGSNGGTKFVNPFGVAVDSNDRIIVVDFSTIPISIQIFDKNGLFLDRIVDSDSTAEFFLPVDVAVDSNDRMIVTNGFPILVEIFDKDGTSVGIINVNEPFSSISGIAVDSNDRIIVTLFGTKLVKIFNPDGTFVISFDGSDGDGIKFQNPFGVAVDSNDRIIVIDNSINLVQIYDSDGLFLDSFFGLDGDGTQFVSLEAIAVDSNDRIIVIESGTNLVQIFEGFSVAAEKVNKKGGSGCNDCTPPTIGLNKDGKRLVDNGFSYNGKSISVKRWHTPYPLINATVGEMNSVKIKVFENSGINNMDIIQFGLGAKEIGEPLSELEVLIEVHLDTFGIIEDIGVAKIVIIDNDNLIENDTVVAYANVVKCQASDIVNRCVQVNLDYSYREATLNNVMIVSVIDKKHNEQSFHFNDGVKVIGESMNPAPIYIMNNKKTNQQTENLILTLTRTDKVNHTWMDENYIEYLQVSNDRFDRITPDKPHTCNDPPLDEINVPTRKNCHFRALTNIWDTK